MVFVSGLSEDTCVCAGNVYTCGPEGYVGVGSGFRGLFWSLTSVRSGTFPNLKLSTLYCLNFQAESKKKNHGPSLNNTIYEEVRF